MREKSEDDSYMSWRQAHYSQATTIKKNYFVWVDIFVCAIAYNKIWRRHKGDMWN